MILVSTLTNDIKKSLGRSNLKFDGLALQDVVTYSSGDNWFRHNWFSQIQPYLYSDDCILLTAMAYVRVSARPRAFRQYPLSMAILGQTEQIYSSGLGSCQRQPHNKAVFACMDWRVGPGSDKYCHGFSRKAILGGHISFTHWRSFTGLWIHIDQCLKRSQKRSPVPLLVKTRKRETKKWENCVYKFKTGVFEKLWGTMRVNLLWSWRVIWRAKGLRCLSAVNERTTQCCCRGNQRGSWDTVHARVATNTMRLGPFPFSLCRSSVTKNKH